MRSYGDSYNLPGETACTIAGCSRDVRQVMWTDSSLAQLAGMCMHLGCSKQPALTMDKTNSFSGGNGNSGDASEMVPVKQQPQMGYASLY